MLRIDPTRGLASWKRKSDQQCFFSAHSFLIYAIDEKQQKEIEKIGSRAKNRFQKNDSISADWVSWLCDVCQHAQSKMSTRIRNIRNQDLIARLIYDNDSAEVGVRAKSLKNAFIFLTDNLNKYLKDLNFKMTVNHFFKLKFCPIPLTINISHKLKRRKPYRAANHHCLFAVIARPSKPIFFLEIVTIFSMITHSPVNSSCFNFDWPPPFFLPKSVHPFRIASVRVCPLCAH